VAELVEFDKSLHKRCAPTGRPAHPPAASAASNRLTVCDWRARRAVVTAKSSLDMKPTRATQEVCARSL
jgi:hypothetical protein